MSKRNYTIDVFKLIFAVLIAFGHFGYQYVSAGVIVICFFVMSGYYLAQSSASDKYDSSFEYTKGRIKRIYIYYLLALASIIAIDLVAAISRGNAIQYIKDTFSHILPELFFVQNIGIFDGGINYPLWQISSLIVGSHILFGLLKNNRRLTINVISPILAIVGCSYYANAFGTNNVELWGLIAGCISSPLFRAISGLSIGIMLFEFINSAANYLKSRSNLLVTIITAVFLGYYLINNDSYHGVMAFIVLLICALSDKGILHTLFNHKIFASVEKASLVIYMMHVTAIKVTNMVLRFVQVGDLGKAIVFAMVLSITVFCLIKVVELLGALKKREH